MDTASRTDARPSAFRALPILAMTALLGAGGIAHAQSSITAKPLPEATCTDLAKTASDKTGVHVDTVVGDAGPYMYSNIDGTACLFSGTATGVAENLETVADIGDGLEGWTRDSAYDADGPGSTSVTYRRGDTDWFSLEVSAEPPAGECDNVMISECKVPMKEWEWTVSGMAFSLPASARPQF